MMGHNISFKGLIWKLIPKLFLLPFLILSTGTCINSWRETMILMQRKVMRKKKAASPTLTMIDQRNEAARELANKMVSEVSLMQKSDGLSKVSRSLVLH